MSQAKIWYVVVDGKPQGPHTQEEIQDDLKAEKINYADLVFRPGLSRWMTVGECQEFERRKDDVEKATGQTVAKMGVPQVTESPDDHWIILAKQTDEKGKVHYVQSGPHAGDVVKKKLKNDELKYTDHIWKKGQKTWEVIGSLEIFERRTESESAPAAVPAKTNPFDDAATVVMASNALQEALKPKKDKATATEALKEELLTEDPDDGESLMRKSRIPKLSRKQMLIAGGVTLGVAITYAALNVVNESPIRQVPRKVASVRAAVVAPEPSALPPGPQAQNPGTRAVNPELENRLPKKPSVLKIVALKMTTDHPQMVLETDLPGGTQIEVDVTARAGSILKYPSYEITKKLTVSEGQLPTVDFTQDKLPSGDYHVEVKGGGLETSSPFSVGEHNEDFQKRLAVFKAKVLVQRKKEKAGLEDGLKFVSRSYSSLSVEYRKAKTTPGTAAKKHWTIMVRSWRKDFERQSGMLKNVEDKNKNYFVFPEALLKLKAVEEQLGDVMQLYDKSVKTGRSIASETDMNDVFLEHVKDLRETVRKIK
jgi:hypothetical protein